MKLSTRTVAAVSLLFTYLFFFEYLPPVRKVHIPYDLDGYHYPLVDYAFQALRAGRFPQWDPTMYCGMSYVGNIQAALFYPPTWLLFLANAARRTLSYQSLQTFELAHVWLAFLFCFLWLRGKRLSGMASVLGAGVYAYTGHLLLQLQHQGLTTACTWMPLGLWGIDEAIEQGRWRPLWKLVAASALIFLAGYPPTWFTYAVCVAGYAVWRWRVAAAAAAALAVSLLVAAVQLLPTWENTGLKSVEARYGLGIRDPVFYAAYLLPNYADFALDVDSSQHPRGEFLYLGAPGLLGLAYLARRRKWREAAPAATVLAVSLIGLTNPLGLVGKAVAHSSLLNQVCRDFYFLAGVALGLAPLAAIGLDDWLRRERQAAPRWLVLLAMALLAGWAAWELALFFPIGSSKFVAGWGSAVYPAVTLALFAVATWLLPGQRGALGTCLAAAILLSVSVDYKVFGTSKRFDAASGRAISFPSDSFGGVDEGEYRVLRRNAQYRVGIDVMGPLPQQLRQPGWMTPQGFDPFLTTQYRRLMERVAHFATDRMIELDPANKPALRLLGVRYFLLHEGWPTYEKVVRDPDFRRISQADSFYKGFEFIGARGPWGWEGDAGAAQLAGWTPEAREFAVRSERGGRFYLSEQRFPGWRATVDGAPAAIEPFEEAFQAIRVPAGEHRVRFEYRSVWLPLGAAISLLTLVALGVGMRWSGGAAATAK